MSDPALQNQTIPISQLTTGMYVLSVNKGNGDIRVKSEGYISTQEGINKLKQAGIKQVKVDPSREKNTSNHDSKNTKDPLISIDLAAIRKRNHKTISLGQEMTKAHKLYNGAKDLQKKILSEIQQDKVINIDEVRENTDAIVDSIFRNQDALSCLSRLRMKDEYLVEHSLNVSILMSIFAKHMKLEETIIRDLALGAFLHDIGKIKVPDEVLHKPGKLTDEEYALMKEHVNYGVTVLNETPGLPEVINEVVSQHHERIDGNGYPNGLSNNDVTLYGRMIAIVDSYDAMTAERVYKSGMHPIKAFKILTTNAPSSYDEGLVEKFISSLGVYPIGTLVKLKSGKLGLISRLNLTQPLKPFVKVFYSARLNQAIAMEELDLSKKKYDDQIDSCIKPEEYNLNLMSFFKMAFLQ